jgi:hypothetical protein
MQRPIVIVGIGEMGGVFARAFLRNGRPVVPVTRGTPIEAVAAAVPDPVLALAAVGEADLGPLLASWPDAWKDRTGLIQNELLPRDWEHHGIADPTVAAVWFEKKPGRDVKVIVPTPVAGPGATGVADALATLGIAAETIPRSALVEALVVKNLYILTANIAGMEIGGTTGELWSEHRDLACAVATDVLAVQRHLTGAPLVADPLLEATGAAFLADPDHGCTGRSAPARLARAIAHADRAGLAVPELRRIHARASR